MTNVQTFASNTFAAYAAKNIRIDEDNNGLFASVPSQDGNWYTVRCVESKKSVHASHCSCHTFSQKQSCGHVELVQSYWNRLYPQVEAPVAVKAPKVKRTPLVRKVRGGGLVRVEQAPKVATIIEQAVEAKVPAPKRDMMKAQLTRNAGFSLMR